MTAENRTMEVRPSGFLMRTNYQAPLQMMAEETGGLAAINTNDWKESLDNLAVGLLQLLLDRLPLDQGLRRPAAPHRGRSSSARA